MAFITSGLKHLNGGADPQEFWAPCWEAPLVSENHEQTPPVNLQWRHSTGETHTFVVTSQEHFGDVCYCSIAESSPTDKNEPMRKGSTTNPVRFLEVYRAHYQ